MKKITFLLWVIFPLHQAFSQSQNLIQNLELNILKTQYDSAIFVANSILEKDSANWKAYYYLGKSYQAKYQYFDALKSFEKANDIDSANRVIENALAEINDFIGDEEKAIQIYYNQYLRDTTFLEPIVNLANIFRKNREYSPAIHYYQKAVASDPENFYYYKQLAYCFNQINIPMAAIYSYQAALMFNPYDLSIYAQLANIFNSERQFTNAIHTCDVGLTYRGDDTQLIKIRAYAYYLNRDFDSSIVGFNKLFEKGDTSFFNLKYQGLAYFEKKEFEKAVTNLKLTREFDESDAEVSFFLGSALGRSGNNKEGLSFLNDAIKILSPSPNEMSNIYSEMANIFLNQEKYESSLEYLKLAYKNNATPLLSFKMAQLYDYYLDNKKLAINYYDAYLTMANESDTSGIGDKSFLLDPEVIHNAKDRIRILTEEQFFESAKE